jgi:hypothetical protein
LAYTTTLDSHRNNFLELINFTLEIVLTCHVIISNPFFLLWQNNINSRTTGHGAACAEPTQPTAPHTGWGHTVRGAKAGAGRGGAASHGPRGEGVSYKNATRISTPWIYIFLFLRARKLMVSNALNNLMVRLKYRHFQVYFFASMNRWNGRPNFGFFGSKIQSSLHWKLDVNWMLSFCS